MNPNYSVLLFILCQLALMLVTINYTNINHKQQQVKDQINQFEPPSLHISTVIRY